MIRNNYSQVWIDGSFLLTRALFALTRGKDPTEVTPGEIFKVNLQTINKLARDWGISGAKIIIIWDKWDQSYNGYIRSWLLKDKLKYKGSRSIMTEEILHELERTGTEAEIKKAKRELALNNLKQATKYAMIEEFPKLGIVSYYYPGYEFDDIVTLASFWYHGKSEMPNIIVTKDTDLRYSLCPGSCNFFSLPTYGSEPKIVTYEEMYQEIPEELRNQGVSLYQYNAMMNAAGFFGHNDMQVTKKKGVKAVETLLKILSEDYSNLKDPELYKLQYETYDLSKFPNIDQVKNDVSKFERSGKYGCLDRFHEICNTYKIEGLSDYFYQGILSRLDEKYYSEK